MVQGTEAEEANRKLQNAAKRQEAEDAALPLMLDAMWAANKMDIDSTVRSVCHKVSALSLPLFKLISKNKVLAFHWNWWMFPARSERQRRYLYNFRRVIT